ncbi:MAG: MATE family efflux transporter [Anaerovoracaceae bacterium]|jgi:putative MATE family efflux protein
MKKGTGDGKKNIRLTEGTPWKVILAFAVPIIIGNLLQELYNVVDTIIVGRTLGSLKLGAVGAAGPIVFLATGFLNGFAGGCTVLTANRYGAGEKEGVRRSTAAQIAGCSLFTIALTVLLLFSAPGILQFLHTTKNMYPYTLRYILVIYAGLPATMLYNLTAAQLRAIGDSRTPLLMLILSSLLNIILDLLFILAFGWGVTGAAAATVLSQLVSGILCLVIILRRYPFLLPKKKDFRRISKTVREEFAVGIPMGLQLSVISIGMMAVQYFVNSFGDHAVSAYTIGNRIQMLLQSPPVSMNLVMASFAGQNAGAERYDRIRKGTGESALIMAVYGIAGGILALIFSESLIRIFISEPDAETVSMAAEYLRWACPLLWTVCLLFVYRGALEGLSDGVTPMIGSFLEVAMRGLIPLFFCDTLGYTAIAMAGPVAWTASAVLITAVYFKRMYRRRGWKL